MRNTIKNGEMVKYSTQLLPNVGNVERVKEILFQELNERWEYWLEIHPDDLLPDMSDLSEDDLYNLQKFYDELINDIKPVQ